MRPVPLHGHFEPRFSEVADVLRRNFVRGDVGQAVCVFHRGRKVVDLWGGLADRASRRPWDERTVALVFSATKGIVAACFLMLAERGVLDLDAPIAHYWPGFGHGSKAGCTVRTLLNHRAGLVRLTERIGLDELEHPERLTELLQNQVPLWAPGSEQGYQAVTYGLYTAELFRRVTGRSLGAFLRDEVTGPHGLDVRLGTPAADHPRVATNYSADTWTQLSQVLPRLVTGLTHEGRLYRAAVNRTTPTAMAFANPAALGARGLHNFNTARVRSMELLWSNAIASARGLAGLYARLIGVDGQSGALCRDASIATVERRQSWSRLDRVLLKPMGFSQGFLKEEGHLFSPNEEAFGHAGAGGTVGLADRRAELAFAYVVNRMDFHLRPPRTVAVCHAIYRAVG